MPRLAASLACTSCIIAFAPAGPASAQAPPTLEHDHGVPVPAAGRPPDSDAPAGAAPHWLPPDRWVHLHWVPFDEACLQRLLHADRSALWAWLRDDTQTLAELGARHGYASPRRLAAALTEPRAKDVSPAKLAELRERTLRVLVQGHLSQHLIFHSLHQEAGPEAAADIFGVRSTAEFQRLRRLDLSPLRIGRTHGRTRAQMQGGLARALRAAARAGVRQGDTSPRQAQSRRVETAYDPALSGDGRRVAYTAFTRAGGAARARLQVFVYDRSRRQVTLVSRIGRRGEPAAEAWEPALSHEGRRIAFAATTRGGARARVYVRDLGMRTASLVSAPDAGFASEPSISADGARVAYAELRDGRSRLGRPRQRVLVRDLASADVSEASAGADGPLGDWSGQPQISGDGMRVALTTDAGAAAGGGPGGLRVLVRDLRANTTTVASPAAPLGSFDSAPALQPGAARLCSLAPPAW